MISVEERMRIIANYDAIIAAQRALNLCRGGGVDAAVELAKTHEAAQRDFYQALNEATDWGTPA